MLHLEFILLLIGLLGQAFFAGMETGVVAINRLRLHHLVHRNVPASSTLQKFINHPDHLLATTLVGTNISLVALSVLSANLAKRHFGGAGSWLAPAIMTVVILVFGEYLPKAYFQSDPARRTRPFANILWFFGYIFFPLGKAITFITGLVFPSLPSYKQDSGAFITREELKKVTSQTEGSSKLGLARSRMIQRVFDLTHKTAGQIMIPREHMVVASEHAEAIDLIKLARENGLSRLPVYQGHVDQIVGIIHILDVLADVEPGEKAARDYMRPPNFVPGDTPADELLPHMRMIRQSMVIVTDDASRILGLVTIEDVLEEIVGKL